MEYNKLECKCHGICHIYSFTWRMLAIIIQFYMTNRLKFVAFRDIFIAMSIVHMHLYSSVVRAITTLKCWLLSTAPSILKRRQTWPPVTLLPQNFKEMKGKPCFWVVPIYNTAIRYSCGPHSYISGNILYKWELYSLHVNFSAHTNVYVHCNFKWNYGIYFNYFCKFVLALMV